MFKNPIIGLVTIIFILLINLPGRVCAQSLESWASWLTSQVRLHPEVVAAKESLASNLMLVEGSKRPLYNPVLETEFEREGDDNNYRIGINQTLDLWDKRGVHQQQAQLEQTIAEQEVRFINIRKTGEVLLLLVEWQAANEAAELARKQQEQMISMVKVVEQRQQAGDAGLIDTELAFLSLSENLQETVAARTRVHTAEISLQELLPNWSPQKAKIPSEFWDLEENRLPEKGVKEHPLVAASRLQWENQKQIAELTRLEARPDPTVGINAGESGRENVFALTLSIPLYIRNSYTAETRAANHEVRAAQARYQAVERRQLYTVTAAATTMREYRESYEQWLTIMQKRGRQSEKLLDTHWRSGDLDTTQYLRIRQQQNENLRTGIKLHTLYRSALIDLLIQTGRINNLLNHLTQK